MGNKYYTPGEEEFHAYFEYEKFDRRAVSQTHDGWSKDRVVCFPSICTLNQRFFQQLDDGKFRVKYLDGEDLESLGFKRNCYYSDAHEGDSYRYEKDSVYVYILPFHKVRITLDQDLQIFKGTVKNKSELKKLLIQLGV